MAADEAIPVGQIAKRVSVSISYVSKVLSRRRLTGERSARRQCCHVPRKLAAYHTAIQERVKARPDATLAELRTWLLETQSISQYQANVGNPRPVAFDKKKDPARGRAEPSRRCPGP